MTLTNDAVEYRSTDTAHTADTTGTAAVTR
jgi:hypothetical protein